VCFFNGFDKWVSPPKGRAGLCCQQTLNRKKTPVLLKNGNPQGNPMNAPRCGAKTRRSTKCRAPAMANGRCRMHGGKSTGPRTAEGLERSRKANWKHGHYSAESLAERRYISWLLRESRETIEQVEKNAEGKIVF